MTDYDLSNEKQERQRQLEQAVKDGLSCQEIHRLVIPILRGFKDKIVDKLCKTNPYYQKVDKNVLAALQCELWVVSELQTEIESVIQLGTEAKARIDAMTEQQQRKPKGYKF